MKETGGASAAVRTVATRYSVHVNFEEGEITRRYERGGGETRRMGDEVERRMDIGQVENQAESGKRKRATRAGSVYVYVDIGAHVGVIGVPC